MCVQESGERKGMTGWDPVSVAERKREKKIKQKGKSCGWAAVCAEWAGLCAVVPALRVPRALVLLASWAAAVQARTNSARCFFCFNKTLLQEVKYS